MEPLTSIHTERNGRIMFNPITASQNIKEEYIDYITTLFRISDHDYWEQFKSALAEDGMVTKGPYLDVTDAFKQGESLSALIEQEEASPLFLELEAGLDDKDKEIKLLRPLYMHQEKAIRESGRGNNLIVTTGTGSGKTECFVIPIINSLLREKEKGTLGPGVRAILVYPMNALANDQMKRLRKLLSRFRGITFGVYNSSTKQKKGDALSQYREMFKDEKGNSLMPSENELISRDQMQETPPNILVTNYAMLEYMLLRPRDDRVFSESKLRFLVLDEAHTYRGTTGMETSLLLQRLKARISHPENVLHILTSATLGGKDADGDILEFAKSLCGVDFSSEGIIRAQAVIPDYGNVTVRDIPMSFFAEAIDPLKVTGDIAEKYGIPYQGQDKNSFLYDACIMSPVYRELRRSLEKPMTIPEVTSHVNEKYPVTEQDIVNMISVASQAEKDGTILIKARYHMFAKALEGAYVTIGSNKRLMLTRTKDVDEGQKKVFECALCDDCGRMALVGKTVNGKLEFCSDYRSGDAEYYFLYNNHDMDDIFDDDEEADAEGQQVGKEDYIICSCCGMVFHYSLKEDPPCTCGKQNYIKVRKAELSKASKEARCPNCRNGALKNVYVGYDAPTAVLGTTLYE